MAIGGAVSGALPADRIGRKVLQVGPLVQLPARPSRTGDFAGAFQRALLVQACLLVAFLAITFPLPRKGRSEAE
ncbi:hypothetical protein ABZ816_04470 [Actinosynnema sp. NPDC047251]|uniref:Putative membrane protein n=1 Tax=Saccharothrix espanaensis (strain ATCC 51144 / DSM 44229 / JCM 9112 / NBRC 15066 / NRRL 15764) TaxID=1179773 RepID=K0K3S9_SACES|nr:hypothetical protein [Saccharothrix espanaensis]CCH31519.1 putative membrane protein [Saccharothrix espanaensis DSM 44229]